MERTDRHQAVRRPRQLCPGVHAGSGVLAGGAQHRPVDRHVGHFPAGDRLRARACAEPEHSRTESAARAVLSAGHHRPDRRRDHVAMDVRSILRAVQRHADGARATGLDPGLARRPKRRALFDVHRLCLADGRIFARSVSCGTAERLPDPGRGLAHRRRGAFRGVPLCYVARATPVDHHRPHPVDHQFAEGLRHRLRHDGWRPGAVDADAGALGLHPGDATRRLRTRRRNLGRPAPDHDRDRHPLSALDAYAQEVGP